MPVIESNTTKRSPGSSDESLVAKRRDNKVHQPHKILTFGYNALTLGNGQETPAYKLPSAQGAWFHVLSTIQQDIQNLSELEDDWDLEGAKAVEYGCIKRSLHFIESLESQNVDTIRLWNMPSVTALLDGGVQLYWYTKSGQTYLNFQPSKPDIFLQRVNQDGKGTFDKVSDEVALRFAMEAMNDL